MQRILIFVLILLFIAVAMPGGGAHAQTFPTPEYFRGIIVRPVAPSQAAGVEGLRDRVVDGKLRLSLADVIHLTLANNTEVRINQLQYEGAKFAIARAYQSVDPVFTATFSSTRSTQPTTDQLQGAATLSSLGQNTNLSFSQGFFTGTRYSINYSGGKSTTNSIFANFNPSITSNLSFNLSQPLLRNFGLTPNRAPLVIARRNLQQSRATFEAQVMDSVAQATDRYWDVVQARESLVVVRKSLDLAETTYKLDKRKLELGALPPLDIYRSESQVATRRVQVIQAEYSLKRLEDELRRSIGADLDSNVRALDLDLIETAEAQGELLTMDSTAAIEEALRRRPELEALRLQLANEQTSIQLAHNGLKPDLNLNTFYTSNGRGGNALDTSVTPPMVISRGGLGDAFGQIGSWDFPTYGFTLRLNLPIKNRVAQADLGSALVSQKRSLFTQRQREQAITLEARNAVHQLEEAKLSMGASRIALDLSRKNLEAEQRKYELGATTIFFVLDAQNQLAAAEQDYLRSQIGYQRAVTSLSRATGALLERHKVQVSDVK